jgi:hypothetical protein
VVTNQQKGLRAKRPLLKTILIARAGTVKRTEKSQKFKAVAEPHHFFCPFFC